MKKIYLIALGALTLTAGASVFTSCNKIAEKLTVNVPLQATTFTFTIPAMPANGPDSTTISIPPTTVHLDVDSIIKAQNSSLSGSNIKSVKITRFIMDLTPQDPVSNFSAVKSLVVKLSSDNKQDQITLAQVDNNPDVAAYELNLNPTSTDLKDYFNAKEFTYSVTGATRKRIQRELQCTATVSYEMTAGL